MLPEAQGSVALLGLTANEGQQQAHAHNLQEREVR
jgi:hypothetical protein